MAEHDSHVVEKRRHGGDRDGERVFYAIGPVRRSLKDAHNDLSALDANVIHSEVDQMSRHIAALEYALREREAEVAESRRWVSALSEANSHLQEGGAVRELARSQMREVELGELLSRACMALSDAADSAVTQADRDHFAAGTREITAALVSPSPVATAIGRVVQRVAVLLERNREVGRTIFPRTEPWAAMWAAMNDLEIEYAALEQARSGKAGPEGGEDG